MSAMNEDEDLTREGRAQAQKDRERAEALEYLLKHDGWSYYVDLLNDMLKERGALLMEPLSTSELNAVERAEHNKGAMYAIAMCRDLPSVIVAQAREARKSEPASEDEDE